MNVGLVLQDVMNSVFVKQVIRNQIVYVRFVGNHGKMFDKHKKQLKKAAKASQKLNRYSSGVRAAGGRDATAKYNELNAIADREIRKLPAHLRSRTIIESFYE